MSTVSEGLGRSWCLRGTCRLRLSEVRAWRRLPETAMCKAKPGAGGPPRSWAVGLGGRPAGEGRTWFLRLRTGREVGGRPGVVVQPAPGDAQRRHVCPRVRGGLPGCQCEQMALGVLDLCSLIGEVWLAGQE